MAALRLPGLVLALALRASADPACAGEAAPAVAAPDTAVSVPEAFRQPARGIDGIGWYRCQVTLPEGWATRALEMFVEPFDAAIEVRVGGVRVGAAGSFPPRFRSGLGGPSRFPVPQGSIEIGTPTEIVIRTAVRDGRTGFDVAAPVLFGGNEAIRLAGTWAFRGGDPVDGIASPAIEPVVLPRHEAEASLRRIDDAGPLPAAVEATRFHPADDLRVDLILAEPAIRQPLSMKWDARGRIWVAEFIQYPEPAGLTMVSRDAFLRSVYDKVPAPPPHGDPGLDRISFHEDVDGDGAFETHGVFVDGLSLLTSFAFDPGGLWVLQPPYLLFYTDVDHDDRPDADPVVHLEGFGIEDSHSIANNLRWGPDGWLYAAQGSTVSSRVRRPGSDAAPVTSVGQCIWRYHPPTGRYEVFAEGGGNAFGVEFDSAGRLLSGHNGGDTRGFHYVQGGAYRKGFDKHGELSNPFAFGFFEPIAHHSAARFTHALAVNDGPGLGAPRGGQLLGVAPLQGHVTASVIRPDRSSIATTDIGVALSCDDPWFRPVDIQLGPDGAVYICDFYEQRIDHASHYQGRIDRERGRIWRLAARDAPPTRLPRISSLDPPALVARLEDPVRWIRSAALERLAAERPVGARPLVAARLFDGSPVRPLDLAWALVRLGTPDDGEWLRLLGHDSAGVRGWGVRLACDGGHISPAVLARLVEAGHTEDDPATRSQLAASARRLPPPESLRLVTAILGRADDAAPADADDIHVPLLLWWAVERLVSVDRAATLDQLAGTAGPLWSTRIGREVLEPRLGRRLALGSRADQAAAAALLDAAPGPDHAARLLGGIELAFQGRSLATVPAELLAAIGRAGGGSRHLRVRLGDVAAAEEAVAIIADGSAACEARLAEIGLLGETRPAGAVATLRSVAASAGDETVRAAAIAALEGWSDPEIAEACLALLPAAPPSVREAAFALLASRPAWAAILLASIDRGDTAPSDMPPEALRRLRLHADPALASAVERRFGPAPTPGSEATAAAEDLARVARVLADGSGSPVLGRTLFRTTCAGCHVLFGEGGQIGPDLTSHDRTDASVLAVHVATPSAAIREGYETTVVVTDDGRTLSGFVVGEDSGLLLLRTADGRTVSVLHKSIEERRSSPVSIMPAGLLRGLDDQQVRDLFAYLRATQPLATK